jgi:hypothetical protein
MRLEEALSLIPGTVTPAEFDIFRNHIDPAWVEEALLATGKATVRRRRLPAELVLWLVVGMALMRNESIPRVALLLGLELPTAKGDSVAKSALAQARQRLGENPMAYLFVVTASAWAYASAARHRWRGLALFGADGSTLRVPDSPENWKVFGGQHGNGLRNGSAYPTVRILALMALRSHLIAAWHFADYHTGETTLAQSVWHDLPDDSVTIVDRNFLVAYALCSLAATGQNRHWLTRAKSTTQLRRVQRLSRNDDLVEIVLSADTRRRHPEIPAVWQARAIKYQRRGFRPAVLLTSLLDAERYPAAEIVALYHERWELELGFDEIKTHMLEREETIRSRTPTGVRQELWGVGLAYNLVRLEMERVADEAGVEPNRISFVTALVLIRNAWMMWSFQPMVPGRIPAQLLALHRQLKLLILPPRRPERAYPRAVKIKMSNYARKAPSGRGRK